MPWTQKDISAALGQLNALSPTGYALGFHIGYGTPKFMFQSYPREWLDYYSANGLLMVDPMVAWGFENEGKARWSTLDDSSDVMLAAAKHGMKYGIVVACVTDESRSIGGFSHPTREFTAEEADTLEQGFIAIHHMTAAKAQLSPKTIDALKKMSIMVTQPPA